MGIAHWDPFKDLITLQDRMNRMFEDSLGRTREEGRGVTGTWTPLVDIYETKDSIVIKAEVPGVERGDLNIEVKDNLLILRGERKLEQDVKEENYHCLERSYGHFARSFSLPNTVQADKINASLKNGVLELIIPKTTEVSPKQVKIDIS